ncbi:MAG: peptidoglycan editing factor PgeF [Planctomycetota bacterium]
MIPDGFHRITCHGVSFLAPDFLPQLGLRGGYSLRSSADGRDLDFDLRGGKPVDRVLENHRLVCGAMGIESNSLITAEQVHGDRVAIVTAADRGKGAMAPGTAVAGVDALVTEAPGTAPCCLAADCPIVLLADEKARPVAAVHSGWRGIAAGVVRAAVKALGELGAKPGALYASIGPSIGVCCYEVGGDVLAAFEHRSIAEGVFARRDGRLFLNLVGAVRRQLLDCGLRAERIFTMSLCTSCRSDLFHSYRRDGRAAGRTAGIISIAP